MTLQPLNIMNTDSATTPLSAFHDERAIKAGLVLVPVTASHGVLMGKLSKHEGYRSPLLMIVIEAAKPEAERTEPNPTGEEIAETIYLLTRPPGESRAALQQGREAFRETALRAISDVLPAALTEQLFVETVEHYVLELIGESKPA